MAPYGTNGISLKAINRNAWDLGTYAPMHACSGTEGSSKTRALTSLKFRKLKLTEHSKITTFLMKTSPLMLSKEIINDYFHDHVEHTKLCEKNPKNVLMLNAVLTHNFHCASMVQWYSTRYLSSCNKTPTWLQEVQKTCDQPIPTRAATLLSTIPNSAGKKGKAVPLQAWSGPQGSSKLRFPDYVTMAQDGGKVVSRFYPRKYSWYSFVLVAESTPGP
jgi:hypothetical protein